MSELKTFGLGLWEGLPYPQTLHWLRVCGYHQPTELPAGYPGAAQTSSQPVLQQSCRGRTGQGRTVLVLPHEQVTAQRLCTRKSSHALAALIHVPFKKETKNSSWQFSKPCWKAAPPLWAGQLLCSTQSRSHCPRSDSGRAGGSDCSQGWQPVQGYSSQLCASPAASCTSAVSPLH